MFDVFFYPVINSTGMKDKNGTKLLKTFIYCYWIFIIFIPLCIVLHNIEKREKNIITQSSTYANFGLWCYLFTILVFFSFILLKVYHYTQSVLGCNNFVLLGYFFFLFIILLYLIFYCIEMSNYLNPKMYQREGGLPFYEGIQSNHIFFSIVFTILILSILFQFLLLASIYYKPLHKFLKLFRMDINTFSNLRFKNEN